MTLSKQRKCKHCKKLGATFKMAGKMAVYCDVECMAAQGITYLGRIKALREKEARKRDKEALAVLDQTTKHWRPKADTAFQLFCRLRDWGRSCISCGITYGQMHGGHYISKGAKKTLTRYAEDNCHSQCSQCNENLGGNTACYRPNLIEKIGSHRVEILEGPMPLVHWIWSDYKAVYNWYNRLNLIMRKELSDRSYLTP